MNGRRPAGRLRSNVTATYASQAYTALVSLAFVPLYLRLLGSEAYGLVGFFAVLQVSFGLLDLGLTRTISREAARFHAQAQAPLPFLRLYRALQVLFLAVAVAGGLLLVALAGPIADHWLQGEALARSEVRLALRLMGATVALRWMGGLYRGVIVGSERLVWMAGFSATMATLRAIGVLGAMLAFGTTPAVFFSYHLVLGVIEVVGLLWMASRQVPRPTGPLGWSIRAVRPLLGFSSAVAVGSVTWIVVTQTDKLVLSRLLALGDYGHFTLGVTVASAVLLATQPLAVPLLPRLASLEASGDASLLPLYRKATQAVALLAGVLSATLAAFAATILWAWTGDAAATRAAAPTVALYAVGNALLAVGAFPFYLQYAKGDLKLHLVGNALFLVVLLPTLVVATLAYGPRGAGWTWLGANLAYLVLWVPLVHRRLVPGLHTDWMLRDVLPILAAAGATAWLAAIAAPEPSSRLAALAVAGAGGLAILAAAVAASGAARQWLGRRLARAPGGSP